MPKQTEPPPAIRISTNTILGNKFFKAYEPLPFARAEDLPENLRPLVVTGEPEPEEPNIPRGNFETGVIYEMTDDGRLGRALRRKVERQVAELEAAAQEAEWIEDELAAAELPPEVADSLQAAHDDAIAFAKAQAEVDARRADEIADAAIAAQEPVQMYVRRGDRHYAPAGSARLKPGEDVFIRQPSGRFHCIGTTDGHSQLPDPPIEI
jgi:hypothetical protein